MNKTEMAMKLAKKTGISQGKAAEIIDTMFSAQPRKGLIATALDAGEKVTIPGFGTFATKQRGARQGRNPARSRRTTRCPSMRACCPRRWPPRSTRMGTASSITWT